MKVVTPRFAALVLIVCSLYVPTPAQRRRPARRTSAARSTLTPLYEEQKEAVTELLDQANKLEITLKYRPEEFADDAMGFGSKCTSMMDDFPDGRVKTLVLKVGQAYGDAGTLHGSMTGTSARTKVYDAFNRGERVEGREMWDYIGGILARYGAERLAPYDAMAIILRRAEGWKTAALIALKRSPVAR